MLLPSNLAVGLWPSMVAVQGAGGASAPHRHHGMHFMLARTGEMQVTTDGAAEPVPTAGVLTPPRVSHAIDAQGLTTILFFVDPESVPGAQLKRRLEGKPLWLDATTRDRLVGNLPEAPDGEALRAFMHDTLAYFEAGVTEGPRTMHPKVKRVLGLLAEACLDPTPALEDYADRVGLAPSRLLHAFTESTGTPWRAYLRWLRFQRAASALSRGASANEAAVTSGFHDAAHMTRTFNSMYGLSPAALMAPS